MFANWIRKSFQDVTTHHNPWMLPLLPLHIGRASPHQHEVEDEQNNMKDRSILSFVWDEFLVIPSSITLLEYNIGKLHWECCPFIGYWLIDFFTGYGIEEMNIYFNGLRCFLKMIDGSFMETVEEKLRNLVKCCNHMKK